MKKLLFSTIILIIILSCNKTASASASADDEVVATWRGGQITLKEYEDFAIYYAFEDDFDIASKSSQDKKREVLKQIIGLKLMAIMADSLNLDTMQNMIKAYENKIANIAFRHHLFVDSVISKVIDYNNVKIIYNEMKKEYLISHILTESKVLADSLYSELKINPKLFQTFVQNYSKDYQSKLNHGSLGWNTLIDFLPEFRDNIKNTPPYQISKPFRTELGWHIAIINDIRSNNALGSFASEKNKIINLMVNMKKAKYDSVFTNFRDFMYEKYNTKINHKEISHFSSTLNELIEMKNDISKNKSRFNINQYLAVLDKDTISVKYMLDSFSKIDIGSIKHISVNDLYDYIFSYYRSKLIPLITKDLGYSELPDVISLANKRMLVFEYKDYFTLKYINDPDGLKKWYLRLFNNFNVIINYPVLEKSFIIETDNHK